ncbi:PD-(D/E)XK nuclease superfamily protein [Carboxydocella sporoproducens DSM 16521]|uniref:PD-(D/E)XK nuclease superfamily protein n=3 Tax=Carboxydocella TaxID=178898 RepID=A0A1T4N7B1_9FIRM|nr:MULTISPECIES: PD-(D/E)XK nuclease family protein [Carboxydocella]AVX20931.1 PD-(D/E)XK nuclease superfamily protein [Carboxydocella thermautotrophica]AVX31346.1 PD-(D/E)XK nuclease superfamily protein [Carboxydocella thermautotrophica]SJZ75071.1 PD-(D/E)XK nuclease superfamily protein [Carboxydocella sporoproducens DSM 16521]
MNRNKKQLFQQLTFSQAALETFLTCRRRFRYRYVDALYWPTVWGKNEESLRELERGLTFHRLAQQYYLTGQVPPVGESNLNQWLAALAATWSRQDGYSYYPEQELRWQSPWGSLLVKYDLLVQIPDGRLLIYDWKTQAAPLQEKLLTERWQTRLYLLVAARCGRNYLGLPPDAEVSLVYWNPRYPAQRVVIPGKEKFLAEAEERLSQVLAEIQATIAAADYPPVGVEEVCRSCEYRPLCQGQITEELDPARELGLEDLSWQLVEGESW